MKSSYSPPERLANPQAAQVERQQFDDRLRQLEEGHVIIEAPKGLYLRSPNGHFWQLGVDDAGAISATDIGTVRP